MARVYNAEESILIKLVYVLSKMITEHLSDYYVKFMLMIEVMIKVILMPYKKTG